METGPGKANFLRGKSPKHNPPNTFPPTFPGPAIKEHLCMNIYDAVIVVLLVAGVILLYRKIRGANKQGKEAEVDRMWKRRR